MIDGPPFVVLPPEGDAIMSVISAHAKWCALRGEQLAQAIRKSAADYARDRGEHSKYERGLSPTKWAEWLRSHANGSHGSNGTNGIASKNYESPKLTAEQRAREKAAADERMARNEAAVRRIEAEQGKK